MTRPVRTAKRRGDRIERKSNRAHVASLLTLCGERLAPRLPGNWRERLPDPASYYGQHVAKLGRPNATGWAQGICPLHEDHNCSLSVCLAGERGNWRCFAGCGGGDLVDFHQRVTGKNFKAAVRDLLGMRA